MDYFWYFIVFSPNFFIIFHSKVILKLSTDDHLRGQNSVWTVKNMDSIIVIIWNLKTRLREIKTESDLDDKIKYY